MTSARVVLRSINLQIVCYTMNVDKKKEKTKEQDTYPPEMHRPVTPVTEEELVQDVMRTYPGITEEEAKEVLDALG